MSVETGFLLSIVDLVTLVTELLGFSPTGKVDANDPTMLRFRWQADDIEIEIIAAADGKSAPDVFMSGAHIPERELTLFADRRYYAIAGWCAANDARCMVSSADDTTPRQLEFADRRRRRPRERG